VICQGLELDSGNPTVQDFRGASENVRHGETVTPSRNRKSGYGNPSPTARRVRFLSRLDFVPRALVNPMMSGASCDVRPSGYQLLPDRLRRCVGAVMNTQFGLNFLQVTAYSLFTDAK
jgi:hypothetical protein